MFDKPKHVRQQMASNAAKKYSDEKALEIINYHNQTKSYKKTKEKFGISSNGTLHYILKNRMVSHE